MTRILKKLSSARIIALGFGALILLGSGLLMLPCSVKNGVELRYIDALYTATSAVCVTGLVTVDAADTFTSFGQGILASLIEIGGLGVTSVGAGVILLMRKKMTLKGRVLVREGSNLGTGGGAVRFIKNVFLTTIAFQLMGALFSFPVFVQNFSPVKAARISLFHSIAAFNNAGFDILGGFQSLSAYKDNVVLNLVTCALIFFGGIGFLVLREIKDKCFRWKKLSMHSKVVISVSLALIMAGTVLLKLTENISWLGALFNSVSARTAGFSSYPLSGFTNAGLLVMILLMFVGASPGSTGGGVKTSTLFVLLQGIKSAATNRTEKAFRYSIPSDYFRKAATIMLFGMGVVLTGTYLLLVFEPQIGFIDALFETTSAFGTTGLSTGITGSLSTASKLLSIMIMYIGRLGPLTVATLWYYTKGERVRFPEGNISIG